MEFRVLSIGEILYDRFPAHKRLGGAPFNVAYHLHHLGMKVRFVSRVGDDEDGRNLLTWLETNGFPITGIQVDDHHSTGEVYVKLDEQGVPEFEIVEPAAYDFIEMTKELEQLVEDGIDLLYLGTLAQRNSVTRNTMQQILNSLPSRTPVLYDINLRQPFYSKTIVQHSLMAATVVKLNESEFDVIRNWFAPGESSPAAARMLMEKFGIPYLCITRGDKGSELYYLYGMEVMQIPDEQEPEIIDTVGAGDGYAAVFAIGILKGWAPLQILSAASEFAAAICRIPGAIPEDRKFYEKFRDIR